MRRVTLLALTGGIGAIAIVWLASYVVAGTAGGLFGLIAGLALYDSDLERELARREREDLLNLRTWWP